jgi:ubiquitin-like-conjugating enzyme ATG3
VSADHAHKTVTLGTHPHLGLPYAYVHPCKHAEMMKRIISARESTTEEEGEEEEEKEEKASAVTIEQYMFIFLKFISAAIPNIEYDFTMDS